MRFELFGHSFSLFEKKEERKKLADPAKSNHWKIYILHPLETENNTEVIEVVLPEADVVTIERDAKRATSLDQIIVFKDWQVVHCGMEIHEDKIQVFDALDIRWDK